MSVDGVKWAFDQRGLKPATKLILVFLGESHNRHTKRCDPSQKLLAEECEVSRSTLNVHLTLLEESGFIRRIQRSNKRTRKQEKTFYILGLDEEHAQDIEKTVSGYRTRKNANPVSGKRAIPCPENGQSRVRTVGHEPEYNPKGTMRASKTPKYFQDQERRDAKEVAEFVRRGGRPNVLGIKARVLECLIFEEMLPSEEIERAGLGKK